MVRSIVAGLLAACLLAGAQSRFIQAELLTGIKTKKAKVGDPVKARTTAEVKLANGVTVPAGSMLLGQLRTVEPDAISIFRRTPARIEDHATQALHPCRDDASRR